MNDTIELNWIKLHKWYQIPLYSLIIVLFCQGIIHLNPYNLDWMSNGSFSWGNLIQFLLVDQTLIECISVAIILVGIRVYSSWMGIERIAFTFKGFTLVLLTYIPLFLCIYFFFAPLTTTLRFFYHELLYEDSGTYFQQYFFLNGRIYLSYLFPTFLTGYAFLISAIVMGKKETTEVSIEKEQVLSLKTQEGVSLLSIDNIVRIQRSGRKTWITTRSKDTYSGSWTLTYLEEMLPKQEFLRINRANILRISYIKSWSHWKDHSYIVRSIDGEEFVVSRARMSQVKEAVGYSIKS